MGSSVCDQRSGGSRDKMAYRGSGSRSPSAYGHTPSYRSVNALPSDPYPSALGASAPASSSFTSGLGRDMARDIKFDIDRELKAFDAPLSTGSLGGSGLTGSGSSSAQKGSSYQSSSATDGKRPVVESSYDSTYRAQQTGP